MHLRLRIALPDYNMDDGKRVDCDEMVKRAKRSEGNGIGRFYSLVGEYQYIGLTLIEFPL